MGVRPRPAIHVGACVNGYLFMADARLAQERLVAGADLLSSVFALGDFVPIVGPGLSLAGKFTYVGVTTARARMSRKAGSQLRSLDDVSRLVAPSHHLDPSVLIVDDADAGSNEVWARLFDGFADRLSGLPMLIIASVTSDSGPPTEQDRGWRYRVHRLIEDQVATWIALPRSTLGDVQRLVGDGDPSVPARLHAATGGNPRLTLELWSAWREASFVVMHHGWRFVPENESETYGSVSELTSRAVVRLVGGNDERRVDQAKAILGHGALQGMFFTASIVADAAGVSESEAEELLAAMLRAPSRPDGLLIRASRSLRLKTGQGREELGFQFVSSYICHALRDNQPRKERRALAVVRALQRRYDGEEEIVAWQLARLLNLAGHPEAARDYERMVEYGPWLEERVALAHQVLEAPRSGWRRADYAHAVDIVLAAGSVLLGAAPLSEVVTMYRSAANLAAEGDLPHQRTQAVITIGDLQIAGWDLGGAFHSLTEAKAEARKLGDSYLEEKACVMLGDVHARRANWTMAEVEQWRALELARALTHADDIACALAKFAITEYGLGRHADAKQDIREALDLLDRDFAPDDHVGVLEHAAHVLHASEPVKADSLLVEALAVAEKNKRPRDAGLILADMYEFGTPRDKTSGSEARRLLAILKVAQLVEDLDLQIMSLSHLVNVLDAARRPEEAGLALLQDYGCGLATLRRGISSSAKGYKSLRWLLNRSTV